MPSPKFIARTLLLATIGISSGLALPAMAADVALARMDCGNDPEPHSVAAFSDTFAYADFEFQLTYSCYLVRHGDRYLLWDTGNPLGDAPEAPKVALVEQLRDIGLDPDAIEFVGISHHHSDHTGQLASFPTATLLIGREDLALMSADQPPAGMAPEEFDMRRAPFAPWTAGKGKLQPLRGDSHDVFGDGSVVMIRLPGHTPGHHALLVRLEQKGDVLLTGDVTHFHENYASNGVPTWNSDRADSLASLDRFRKTAENLDATVIIQHDPRDIGKLPAWPAFAD